MSLTASLRAVTLTLTLTLTLTPAPDNHRTWTNLGAVVPSPWQATSRL